MSRPPLVHYDTPAKYRQHYEKHYCRQKIITFDNIRVYFKPTKFGHAFYESSAKDGRKDKFSDVRAQRIDWIRATLENPKAELYVGWNKEKKIFDKNRRVSIVYEDFIVVIEINKTNPLKAEFITAYVADNSIKGIRKSPKWRQGQRK